MNLVKIIRDDVFTDSMVIANGTGNEHESIVRLITEHRAQFEELGELRFSDLKSGNSAGGRPRRVYTLNEPQATFLVTLLRNSRVVVNFKLRLVKDFYRMRTILWQKQTSEWQLTREQGKLIRRDETDAIQKLILLAREQGSKNSDKLYVNYTKLVNKAVGLSAGERETASYKDLMLVALLEDMISNTILEEIGSGTYYKAIYQKCKAKVEQFAQLAYMDRKRLSA